MPTAGAPGDTHLRYVQRDVELPVESWMALYADPDADDLLAGDVVVVLYLVGHETRTPVHEGEGTWSWVRGDAPDDDQEVDQVVVGGRGPSAQELRGMLERVALGERMTADGELRPAHLAPSDQADDRRLVAEGPIDPSAIWWPTLGVLPAGSALQWAASDGAVGVRVSTAEADSNTALLLRALIEAEGGAVARDVDVSFGSPTLVRPTGIDGEALAATWVEDGLVVLVTSSGLERDVVLEFIRDLRVTDESDWPALADFAEEFPPIATPGSLVLSDSFDGGRWYAITYDTPGTPTSVEFAVESVDASSWNGGSVGDCAGTSLGRFDGPSGWLLGGVSSAGTERVALEFDDGSTIEVTPEELPDGAAAWGAYIERDVELVAVTAIGGDGAVLERLDESNGEFPPATNLAISFCPQPSG